MAVRDRVRRRRRKPAPCSRELKCTVGVLARAMPRTTCLSAQVLVVLRAHHLHSKSKARSVRYGLFSLFIIFLVCLIKQPHRQSSEVRLVSSPNLNMGNLMDLPPTPAALPVHAAARYQVPTAGAPVAPPAAPRVEYACKEDVFTSQRAAGAASVCVGQQDNNSHRSPHCHHVSSLTECAGEPISALYVLHTQYLHHVPTVTVSTALHPTKIFRVAHTR